MKGKSSFFVYLFLIYDITVLVLARKRALLRIEVVKLAGSLFYAADENILLADESAS